MWKCENLKICGCNNLTMQQCNTLFIIIINNLRNKLYLPQKKICLFLRRNYLTKTRMKSYIIYFLKGMAVGLANIIPGVSGGTIALITGIFERLINSIKSFGISSLTLLFKGRFKEFAKKTDLFFLVSLIAGAIGAVVLLARVFDFLFEQYPVYIWSFFFGLILASVYFVGKTVEHWRISAIISFILGTSLAISFTFLTPASQNNNFLYLILCGVVAVCSMILPGLSGSFVLILMGNYQLVAIDAINNMDLTILFPVLIGAVGGLVAFSHILSWVFKRYKDQNGRGKLQLLSFLAIKRKPLDIAIFCQSLMLSFLLQYQY